MAAGAEGLFLLWVMSPLPHAGRFAAALQEGLCPAQAAFLTMTSAKNPSSGIYF